MAVGMSANTWIRVRCMLGKFRDKSVDVHIKGRSVSWDEGEATAQTALNK